MVSEWIRELQNLTTLKGAVSRLSCSFFNRELEQQRFWATDVNGKWTFYITGEWFGWNSRVNRLYKRKETEQYKFVSAKADKTEERLTSGWRASLKNVFAQGDYTREESQHCRGIVPNVFFRLSFRDCKSCVYNCDDHPLFNSSLRSSHIWFSYIPNFIVSNSYNIAPTLQCSVALKMVVANRPCVTSPLSSLKMPSARPYSPWNLEIPCVCGAKSQLHVKQICLPSIISNFPCRVFSFFTIPPPYLKETRPWDKQQKWTLITARLTRFQKLQL